MIITYRFQQLLSDVSPFSSGGEERKPIQTKATTLCLGPGPSSFSVVVDVSVLVLIRGEDAVDDPGPGWGTGRAGKLYQIFDGLPPLGVLTFSVGLGPDKATEGN